MRSVTALRRWLLFVGLLRLFSVVLGYGYPSRIQTNVYNAQPEQVTNLQARTFATWTLTSCLLCLICAHNPRIRAIYGATLGSFLIALLHFLTELFVFKTLDWKTAIQPMTVATVSSLWMIAGWNYYTAFVPHAEPTISEETTVQTVTEKDK